ncbi:MAG: tRNA (adenosine(37)-N6)-dimethylallyltransferase MiaA [Candidatus Obscuribacterales bacterium]|nr:tRNA (adenosine(37)-N6)-dimethylallyltransferase MiaA [Candidatus Obscuribacterales bacterium]
MSKTRVVAIVGPTCTGKTSLSLNLAERFSGEIIACDSRTVYRKFDVGTAKPSPREQQKVRHHLIDVADPPEEFTAAQFAQLATQAIEDVAARSKLPIVCGGTGFYARALLEGIAIPNVAPNPELRAQLQQLADEQGNQALHNKLNELDPITAQRLNANDLFRVIRALEVCIDGGAPFSSQAGRRDEPFDTLWIGLTIADRGALKELLTQRLKEQMECGMLEETEKLYKEYGRSLKLLHTVNYSDLLRFLEGELTLEAAFAECERHNYQLARRQIQWFRANSRINWFNVDEISKSDLNASVASMVETFIASGS